MRETVSGKKLGGACPLLILLSLPPAASALIAQSFFFISISNIAANPAISIVIDPTYIRITLPRQDKMRILNRMRRNTPAVTNVDEWTNADTGVGAAIAAGSQEEKGIWALFVQADTISNVASVIFNSTLLKV